MWVFVIKDKLGRNIHLSKERWRHIQEREEIPDIQEIIDTITQPAKITQPLESNRTFYYSYHKKRKEYILIVVTFINEEGYIITSYYTNKIK